MEQPVAETKTATITVRVAPTVKARLREVANREHRSLANMLEVMIRYWCDAHKAVPSAQPRTDRSEEGGPAAGK
jgi:hypothetical protein